MIQYIADEVHSLYLYHSIKYLNGVACLDGQPAQDTNPPYPNVYLLKENVACVYMHKTEAFAKGYFVVSNFLIPTSER